MCLLGPVVRAWPDAVERVRALRDSGELLAHADQFVTKRWGHNGRPAELLSDLLGPALASKRSRKLRVHLRRPAQQAADGQPNLKKARF